MSESSGRRARNRLAKERALKTAALELTLEHGLDNVTIEDIAARAGVSRRTFFYYFSSKHESIVGISRDAVMTSVQRLRDRPLDEAPVVALGHVLREGIEDSEGIEDDALLEQRWEARGELVRRHASLFSSQIAALVALEDELTAALGERLGLDPDTDAYPRAVVAACIAVCRATIGVWHHGDRSRPRPAVIAAAIDQLARGLPAPPVSTRARTVAARRSG